MLKGKKRNVLNEINTIFSYKDNNLVLHTQTQTCTTVPKNVLLFPGIPGLSSEYFLPLAHILKLPTYIWRIDLPGNGGNFGHRFKNFDAWLDLFLKTLERFDRPILISHSFGGMIPLMLPETEELLSGIIFLNSAPSLPNSIKFGKELLLPDYEFSDKPASWIQKKITDTNYTAQWVPENIPTLVLGGKNDSILPFDIFKSDERFQKSNITMKTVPNSGHFCWHNNPLFVRKTIYDFLSDLFKSEGF